MEVKSLSNIKLVGDSKGHVTREQRAQHKDARKALFDYSELNEQPPKWLQGAALTEWKRIVPLLKKDTAVSDLDAGLIGAYCRAYQTVQTCEIDLKKHGLVITNPETGIKKKNPYYEIQSQAFKDMKMIAAELGLSLNSRQKLELNKAKSKDTSDPFEALLK